ncbi:MAG: hypothetical protein ABEJ79_06595 [Halolamina sp.]
MFATARRLLALTVYQLTVVLGLLMLPVAVLARRVGLTLPVGRLVTAVNDAYGVPE